MEYVIFNHNLMRAEEVRISPQDRGFRYGDGVFDTMIVRAGRIYQPDFHLRRLEDGLGSIKINFDVKKLPEYFTKLIYANNFSDGLLRVQISRGTGGRGYSPDTEQQPTLLIETIETPSIETRSVTLWQSSYQKISPLSLPVRFKLCQGLNSTLARMEAAEHNCFDALLLNEKNEICETSSANIFWFKGDTLYTPSLACGVLEGSVRSALMRLSPYKIQEVVADIEALQNADSVLVTNVSWKILPVRRIEPLGLEWKSEELAAQLLTLLEADIDKLRAIS